MTRQGSPSSSFFLTLTHKLIEFSIVTTTMNAIDNIYNKLEPIGAFDGLDDDNESMKTQTYSHEDFLYADARCISIDFGSKSSHTTSMTSTCSPTSTASYLLPPISCCYTPVTDGRQTDITNDYCISATILGTGNYGCVRECQHRISGLIYAVKTIIKAKVSRYDHITREIELLRSVGHHRNIMRLVDCYEDAHNVHIITERYTGGELFDRIVNNTHDTGCLDEADAIAIIKSLLHAVKHLHDKNIVHRDIKPENILFETSEHSSTVKLIDFGLSRHHDPLVDGPYMTNRVGTPYYMSPDVLRGKYDRSCDLWSVGVVTYILLTGYPPFNGCNDLEVHVSIRSGYDYVAFDDSVWGKLSGESRDFIHMLLCRKKGAVGCSAEEALKHPWMR